MDIWFEFMQKMLASGINLNSGDCFNLVPRVLPHGEGRKDPGRRWSCDLLKSILISNPKWGQ
jgi:hypothetical protein